MIKMENFNGKIKMQSNKRHYWRYYYFNNNKINLSTVDFDLQLVTANIKKNKGSILVKYSVVRYDKKGNIVNGSIDILSYWKIIKIDVVTVGAIVM